MSYTHSETFSTLKAIEEEVKVNLTSAQYLHTLDSFLWQAIAPIAKDCPGFFNNYIAKCLAAQTMKPSTKYTSADRRELPTGILRVLLATTAQARVEAAQELYLNRGLLFGLISLFEQITRPYYNAAHPLSRATPRKLETLRYRAEKRLGHQDPDTLYSMIQQVRHWQGKAYWFKDVISQKFMRLAMTQAQKTYVDFGHRIELDDISMIYVQVVNKAIDRCASRLGVLSGFIPGWFPSARSIVNDMDRPPGLEESLDEMVEAAGDAADLGAVDPDGMYEKMQHISYKSQIADLQGIVRISLGIPQYMSQKNRNILKGFIQQ